MDMNTMTNTTSESDTTIIHWMTCNKMNPLFTSINRISNDTYTP